MISTRSAGLTAAIVLGLSLVAGAAAGLGIGATKTNDGNSYFDASWAVMIEQPLDGAAKTFNWLLFCLFAAAGIVAAAAVWAAVIVSNSIADAHGQQMKSLAALKPPPSMPPPKSTPSTPPRPSGAFFGVKPDAGIDPPYL